MSVKPQKQKCKNKDCQKTFTVKYNNGIKSSNYCPSCTYKRLHKSKESKKPIFNKKEAKSKKSLEKQLDIAWSYLVKLKADKKCEKCGKTTTLNSHHLFSRAKRSVRWKTINGICLCVDHHIGVNFSAHKTPLLFDRWLINEKGDKFVDELSLLAGQHSHYSEFELKIILKELKNEIAKYEKEQ